MSVNRRLWLREEKLVFLPFFAYQFFRTCFFIYAVDKLFFLSNGINLFQIAILVSLWSGMCLVLEIPVAILSDRWNRRYMLMLSGLFYSLSFLVWYRYATFEGICLGYFLNALGCTFGGTMQSYLYDMLVRYHKTHMFEQLWGYGYACNSLGFAVALGLGGIFSEFSYTLPLAGSIFSGVLTLLCGFLLPDIEKQPPAADVSAWKFLKNSVQSAFSHPAILNAFLFTAVVRSSYAVVGEYWSVYFNSVGMPNVFIGILMAVSTTLGGFASLLAYRLKKSASKTVNLFSFFIGTVMLLAGFAKSWIIVAAVLFSLEIAICVATILVDGIIQQNVVKERRATVCSIHALFQDMDLLSGIIFGYLLHEFGISFGYGFLGIFVLAVAFLQWLVLKKSKIPFSIKTLSSKATGVFGVPLFLQYRSAKSFSACSCSGMMTCKNAAAHVVLRRGCIGSANANSKSNIVFWQDWATNIWSFPRGDR